jgi:hypothetical protein
MFYLSRLCQRCHNFEYFGQRIKIFLGKKVWFINFFISLALIGTDPDPPDPDPCPADPGPDPTK